ncbi:hypothetical protein BKA70DRAFT_60254 [Coprinopsis sp. MPI-PUGE-AT-0042]|nr:hypothetical protein BKA70DRAFT_60254 [Coprinopsis sp. MPI-PUGE-AT-0042]
MYAESNGNTAVDPYSDAYNAPPAAAASDVARGRSRSRSPAGRSPGGANGSSRDKDGGRDRDRDDRGGRDYRSPPPRRRSPPPKRTPVAPNPSSVLGVFGLSIRTRERDLDDEFSRFGRVENVTIVYDQRSDRSRGFGFIRMSTTEEATRCIQELNGVELNGRRIRVDYSVTERPHAPTPGEYMGHRRAGGGGRDSYRSDRFDRDRDYRRGGGDRGHRDDRDKDRDPYGRDRDWRDRRSPAPRSRDYSPDRGHRRRRSYSRSPAPRSPAPRTREFDAPASNNGDAARW